MPADDGETPADGKGVDRTGGPVVDPTKNVLDLVREEARKRDELRVADKELLDSKMAASRAELMVQAAIREGQATLQKMYGQAESKRIDQLANQRDVYERRIADMLSESVKSTSALVSTQLLQIQSTFDARVNKLEEFRLLSTGRSSIADPALAEAMTQMAASITTLRESGKGAEGRGVGRAEIIGWIAGAFGIVSILTGAYLAIHGSNAIPQPVVQYVPAPTVIPAPVTVPATPR